MMETDDEQRQEKRYSFGAIGKPTDPDGKDCESCPRLPCLRREWQQTLALVVTSEQRARLPIRFLEFLSPASLDVLD
jgi:hypothetical protein